MKVQFHGVDDSNGPVGVYFTATSDAEVKLLAELLDAVGNTPPINACPSDDTSKGPEPGQWVINGILDIFPDGPK